MSAPPQSSAGMEQHCFICTYIHLIGAFLVNCITTGEWALGTLARAASKLSVVSFRLFQFDIKLFQGGLLSFPPLPRWFELPLNTDFTKVVPGLLFPVQLLTKGYLNLTSIKSEGGDVCICGECGGASAFTFSAYVIS